jgi:hypothetical protein
MNEYLKKASQDSQSTAFQLRSALTKASALESLILMQLISDAVKLTNQIDAMLFALAEK